MFSMMALLFYHQQCMEVLIYSYPHQHLLFSILYIMVILVGMKWFVLVIFICISLLISDAEHFCVFVGYLHIFFGEMFI